MRTTVRHSESHRSTRKLVLGCLLVLLTSCSEDEDEALTTRPQRVFGYGSLRALVVSPDGRHLITGGSAGAYVWDLETGQMIQSLRDRYQHVTALAVSPDGRHVVTAAGKQSFGSRSARLWDLNSGGLLRTFAPTNWVEAVAFSPDGKQVLTGGAGGAQLWDLATAQVIREFGSNEEAVESVAFSADGVRVATGSSTNAVRVWETETGRLLLGFATSSTTEGVSDLEFSPDGTRLLTAGDRGAQLWDLATGGLLLSFGAPNWVEDVAFSPDGLRVITAGWDGLQMWDATTGELIPTFNGDGLSCPADFTPDGRQIVARESWERGPVCVLNAQNGQILRTFRGHNFGVGGKGWIAKPLALSPDGNAVVLYGNSPAQLVLWDVRTGQSLRDFNHDGLYTWLAAFSPDSKRMLTSGSPAGGTNVIQLWDVATGEFLRAFGTDEVGYLGFSPDGRQILAQDSEGATLWDATTGQLLHRLPFPQGGSVGQSGAPSFSRDSRMVLMVGYQAVDVWDAQQGTRLRSLSGDDQAIGSAIFSPDAKQLLIGHLGEPASLGLYSLETGARLRTFEHGESIKAAAFSPDGLRVVAWEESTTLGEGTQLQFARAVIWDATTAQPLRVFKHVDSGGIERACFSADGKWLLIAGPHCVRLWDAATGDWLRSFEGESPAWFLPDGKAVLTASGPGSAALWDIRDLLARPRIQRDPLGLEIAWDLGTLQYAPTAQGPWADLPAVSPYRLSTVGEQGYFRVKIE